MTKKPYYITTAIAYSSGKPHIGNVYEIVLADAIARFKREQGYDVYFQTGTDEHGQKIAKKASEKGLTPQQHVDEVTSIIKHQFDMMNVSYDRFMRTTEEEHKKQVAAAFKKMFEKGDIYKDEYEGWYCVADEAFYTESQVKEGVCPDCGQTLTRAKEESYFFKLSKYQDQLKQYLIDHPEFIDPSSRKNEMINNFINPGLQDLAVSRSSFDWGIKTFDEKHVIYVWLDALMNYITSLGYDVEGNHGELFKKYWPADLHLIGKDIVRFHTIYWPIFLFSLDIPLPKKVFGHPWLLVGEDKMSKSLGNVIYTDELVSIFGVDAIRYIMLHEMPFERDGHITRELIIERINSDLANVLGNLVKRTLSMNQKYFNGKVQKTNVSTEFDQDLISKVSSLAVEVTNHMEALHIADAISAILETLRRCNKYIDETEPWKLGKDESESDKLQNVLYNLCESIRICGILLRSFLPETSDAILTQLQTQYTSFESAHTFGISDHFNTQHDSEPLFLRHNVEETLEKLQPKKKVIEHKPEIGIDDFDKIELRKGTVLECKAHPKADKLLIFQVDLGDEVRQIVSGIANSYNPVDLIGKEVLVCVNLKPIKLRGEESNGMILSATKDDGTFQVVEIPHVSNGNKIS